MSNLLVDDYVRMAEEKRNANYESWKISYYRDALLINFTKSVQDRQKRRLNRKRRRTASETSETPEEMVKRMKKIDEEMQEWRVEKKELPLEESAEPRIEEPDFKESSEAVMTEEESDDIWEDAKEEFEEPAEEQAYNPFYSIFVRIANFLHF